MGRSAGETTQAVIISSSDPKDRVTNSLWTYSNLLLIENV